MACIRENGCIRTKIVFNYMIRFRILELNMVPEIVEVYKTLFL